MSNREFSAPVFLILSGLGNFRAENPWDCYEYLDLHWPAARAAEYRRAKALCRVAIDGGIQAETARRAVVALARRQGLLAAGPGSITGKRPAPYRFTPKRASSGPLGAKTITALASDRSRIAPPADGRIP